MQVVVTVNTKEQHTGKRFISKCFTSINKEKTQGPHSSNLHDFYSYQKIKIGNKTLVIDLEDLSLYTSVLSEQVKLNKINGNNGAPPRVNPCVFPVTAALASQQGGEIMQIVSPSENNGG